MAIIKNPEPRKREINLLGPDGNAYFLLGTAQKWGKQLDLDVDSIIKDMESSDLLNKYLTQESSKNDLKLFFTDLLITI